MRILFTLLLVTLLGGCAVTQKTGITEYRPEPTPNKMQKEFDTLPPPNGKKVTAAVYSFADKTGQRKPTPGIASLSSAVTQGAEVFLIKALQDVGRGEWFDVVERVGIDSLTKERTIIRQMREAYEGKDAKPLMPLQFAGIIMEGGIIGYDSSSESGGAAYRFLGIGPQTQYSKDTVTISLRAVSVNTGKVLAAVSVTKIVYSTSDSVAVLKFIENKNIASQIFGSANNALSPTASMFEFETGLTINEPGTLAVKATVEAAVVELIKEGERKGVWNFKREETRNDVKPVTTVTPPAPAPIAEQPAKKEEPRPAAVAETKAPVQATVTPATVANRVWLRETEYIHKEKRENGQKTWQFLRGTELTVVATEGEWLQVKDHQGRGGYVLQKVVSETPLVVGVNEPKVKSSKVETK